MKILVTGGGGFLGRAICRQLAALGFQVIAFQRSALQLTATGITSAQGDICNISSLRSAATGCHAIIHTAAKAGIWGNTEDYRRINVEGTNNVLQACAELNIKHLVYTSTPSVVHAGGDIEGADESLPIATHFSAPYPASKAEAEKAVLEANQDNFRTVALRPHLIWGPGDPHILPRLASKARNGKLALPGPDKVIDTIFVENAAQAHVMALQELMADASCAGKAYFITNNEPMPQGEIIQKLLAASGIEVKIRAVPIGLALIAGSVCEFIWRMLPVPGEPPITRFAVEQLGTAHWFDTSAAERDFGYRPEVSIAEGLEFLRRSSGV